VTHQGTSPTRFFEYEKVEVCVGVNESRDAFQMSAFGGNTV